MTKTSKSKSTVGHENEKTMSEIIDAHLNRRTALKAFFAAGLFGALNSNPRAQLPVRVSLRSNSSRSAAPSMIAMP
jgi:hypothetical protein